MARTIDNAKSAKEDEFYTRLEDIEAELCHYQDQFMDKVVICNCDDPRTSNFKVYFKNAFRRLGLKKLICTCYESADNDTKQAVCYIYDGINEELYPLQGDGDFNSDECIKLLKQADIVVTNPPFSLFRKFIGVLMQYEKKFLVIGNQNVLTYKEVYQLIQQNKVWLGYKFGNMVFRVPSSYQPRETRYWQDDNGQKWRSLGNVCWLTNLDIKKRHGFINLHSKYSPEKYHKYDNYNAINVDSYLDIPCDYEGEMGVPITFLGYYCPEQFEIIRFRKGDDGRDLSVNGKCPYFRVIVRKI